VLLSYWIICNVRPWLAVLLVCVVLPFAVFRVFYSLCMRPNYRNPYYMGYFVTAFAVTMYLFSTELVWKLWAVHPIQLSVLAAVTAVLGYCYYRYASGFRFN